jgi:hypothetical protein
LLETFITGTLGGAVAKYGVTKILDQYLLIPLTLKIRPLKHKGMAHEYEGNQLIMNYWKDFLGPDFALENDAKRCLDTSHLVIFRDVIVTDFSPRAPGYYYSKELWSDPKNALLSLGVVRVIPNEETKSKRLLSLHRPPEFEAHADIEKGVSIVVSDEVYKELSPQLNKYGSAHIDEIVATMSDVGTYKEILEMKGIPSTFPFVESKTQIKHIGDPLPIMGNGWVVYTTQKIAENINYRFWTGVDYYSDSLQNAKVMLKELIPKDGGALTNFDEKIRYFRGASLQSNDIWKYLKK